MKLDQIETYKELRELPVGSYFLGIFNVQIARAFKITKIDDEFVHVFSTYAGIFHFENFNDSRPYWDYYKISPDSPSFFAYINLF